MDSDSERELADAILKNAEARYLLIFGWTRDGEGLHEPIWSYNGPEEGRRIKWNHVTQSHAVNAQKQVDRERRRVARQERQDLEWYREILGRLIPPTDEERKRRNDSGVDNEQSSSTESTSMEKMKEDGNRE